MSLNKLNKKQLKDGAISNNHVAADAAIAESKLNIGWATHYTNALKTKKLVDTVQMNGLTVVAGSGSTTVNKGAGAGEISGDYAATSEDYGVTSDYKVTLRNAVDGQPLTDGSGNEIWAAITYDDIAEQYTLTYNTGSMGAPTAANIPTGITSVDIQYYMRFDLDTAPENFASNEKFFDGAVDINEYNNLVQMAKDIYGSGWALDNNGVANLSTSLKDEIERLDADVNTANSVSNKIKVEALDELASTVSGKGASLVSINDTGALLTATTVEGALQEIQGNVNTLISDLASTANGKGASLIGIEDSGNVFTATTVEAALAEIEGRVTTLEDSGGAEVEATHSRDAASTNGYFVEKTGVDEFASLEARLVDIETVVDAQAKSLQDELDATQTGAGLETDGTYGTVTGTNYLNSSSSLKNADALLDTAIKANADAITAEASARSSADSAIQSELDQAESSLGLETDGTFVQHSGTNYIDSGTTFKAIDALLDTQIKANADAITTEASDRASADSAIQSELDTTQSGAGLETNGSYAADVTTNYLTAASSLKDADKKLDTQVKANADDISTLQSDASGLQSELDDTQAGAGLDANGDYVTRTGSNYLDSATTLHEADTLLDAQAKANADAISAEVTARTNADSAIQSELDATQTGSGLETNGSYSANGSTNYLGAASSLKDADEKLDAEIKTINDWKTANNTKIHTHGEEGLVISTGDTTEYILQDTNVKDTDFIGVYVNGNRQLPNTHYTKTIVNNKITKVTFSDTLVNNDNVYVEIVKYNS